MKFSLILLTSILFSGAFLFGGKAKAQGLVDYPCQEYGPFVVNKNYHCLNMRGGSQAEVVVMMNGFTDTQMETIHRALAITEKAFNDYWQVSNQPLLQCVNKYATKDLDPNGGMSLNFPERERKIVWALTVTQFAFRYHETKRLPIIFNAFSKDSTSDGTTIGRALIGQDKLHLSSESYDDRNLNIELNKVALDLYPNNPEVFAGTIYHEWMHRVGYDHPNGYEGSMIKELGLCITRGNSDKSFGLADPFADLID